MRGSSAQEAWKAIYRAAKQARTSGNNTEADENLIYCIRYRREAALERKLEAAQRRITQLQDRVWQLEAQEHNRDDGNEWEKEYYLRGMHR